MVLLGKMLKIVRNIENLLMKILFLKFCSVLVDNSFKPDAKMKIEMILKIEQIMIMKVGEGVIILMMFWNVLKEGESGV
jgi:hypothetical protein